MDTVRLRSLRLALYIVGTVFLCGVAARAELQNVQTGSGFGRGVGIPVPAPLEPPDNGSIVGTVRDAATGHPLAGIRVSLENPLETVVTNDRGEYGFVGIRENWYLVRVFPPDGYAMTTDTDRSRVSVAECERVIVNFNLTQCVTLRGTVIDVSGRNVAHTQIEALWGGGYRTACATDSEGRFKADVAPNCGVVFRTSHDGQIVDDVYVQVGETDVDGVEVHLQLAGSVSGYVVDRDQRLLPRARVILEHQGQYSAADADEEGRFSLADLLPGNYEIYVGPTGEVSTGIGEVSTGKYEYHMELTEGVSGRIQRVSLIRLSAGEQRTALRLRYSPTEDLRITGRITDIEGNPLVDAKLFWVTKDRRFRRTVKTEADGTFIVHDLEPGYYQLRQIMFDGKDYLP